ncbi:hypothetical protein CDAR_165731 [Caerostris darwini]|uniref:Uncharacterized protein n=1 Tax=Caerostris darwini TaxID=1538125 RepID=A0AAV4W978_9ARAC|nr:hypothetical protein CDAR_165731 [Caerostris darwini]
MNIIEILNKEFISNVIKRGSKELPPQNSKKNRKNIAIYRNERVSTYDINDLVAIQWVQFGAGMKMRPKYFGSYKVIQVNTNARCEMEKIGSNITSTSVNHIK